MRPVWIVFRTRGLSIITISHPKSILHACVLYIIHYTYIVQIIYYVSSNDTRAIRNVRIIIIIINIAESRNVVHYCIYIYRYNNIHTQKYH